VVIIDWVKTTRKAQKVPTLTPNHEGCYPLCVAPINRVNIVFYEEKDPISSLHFEVVGFPQEKKPHSFPANPIHALPMPSPWEIGFYGFAIEKISGRTQPNGDSMKQPVRIIFLMDGEFTVYCLQKQDR